MLNWLPPCLSFLRFVPCCHCLCIRSFVPCHWNVGLLRLVWLNEYGLGTQSLGLDWPLSEVGTWLEQQIYSSPRRLIIKACLTAWRQRTNNNNNNIMVGIINLNFLSFMVISCSSNCQVRRDQIFKAGLESYVFILLTTFFFCCSAVSVHVPVPRQIKDVQPVPLF